MFRIIILTGAALALFAGGCAGVYKSADLDIGHNPVKVKLGPLSSVRHLRVEVQTFADKRNRQDRIGNQRDIVGKPVSEIHTTRPVPELVRGAIVSLFEKNGHTITSGEKDIVISGSIETFWFEYQIEAWTVENMGTIDITMAVQDGRTGNILLSKQYSGHHNTERWSSWHKEWAEEMDATLDNLVYQISNDAELIEMLSKIP